MNSARPVRAWHGVAVVGVALFLYLPTMGSYGLWDPWEGHYAEVARQMLERQDPIELHWHNGRGPDGRKENVFWSKPVLSFWLMAAGLALGGFNDPTNPGEMVLSPYTEWALRWPFVLLGVLGVWAVWFAISRLISARAGLLGGIILATSPMYFFIARQAMTDMPFVSLITLALCFFLVAMFGDETEAEAKTARRIFWGLLLACVLPQTVMLVLGLRRLIALGSWKLQLYGIPDALPYLLGLLLFVLVSYRCRTARHIYLFLFYLCCGLAMLAKGLPGPALPGLVVLAYLLFTGEWKILARAELWRGALLFSLVAIPWYHGMIVKAGRGFYNEFFGHHHLKRLTTGVHGDKGTFEYFVHQLGFGLFPWSALLPAALFHMLGLGRPQTNAERTRLFCSLWFLATFTLFALAVTKFHHYIFPAVPPLAILLGIWVDDLLENRVKAARTVLWGSLMLFVFVARDLVLNGQRLIWLFVYNYARAWPSDHEYGSWILGFSLAFGLALIAVSFRKARRIGVSGLVLVSIAFGYFALNKYMLELSPHWSQKEVLKSYYRQRSGPEEELVAWQMNWRGETFYTKADIVVAMSSDNSKFIDYLRSQEGKRVFLLCERSRYASLSRLLPTERAKKSLRIADGRSNKFYLVVTEM